RQSRKAWIQRLKTLTGVRTIAHGRMPNRKGTMTITALRMSTVGIRMDNTAAGILRRSNRSSRAAGAPAAVQILRLPGKKLSLESETHGNGWNTPLRVTR